MDNRVLGTAIRSAASALGSHASITRDAVQAFFRRLQGQARAGVNPNRRPEGTGRCIRDQQSNIRKLMRAARREGHKYQHTYRKTAVSQMLDARGMKP